MPDPRFKLVVIEGKNRCRSNEKCRLKPQDSVCWVNPTSKTYQVRFSVSPFVGGKKTFTVKAGKASRWFRVKKGLKRGDIFPYRLATPAEGGGPGGPEIISSGG